MSAAQPDHHDAGLMIQVYDDLQAWEWVATQTMEGRHLFDVFRARIQKALTARHA